MLKFNIFLDFNTFLAYNSVKDQHFAFLEKFLEDVKMEEKKSFNEFLCSSAGRVGMIVVFYAIILLLLLGCMTIFENSTYAPLIIAVVLGFFGWKSLNKIQPDIFLFMPIIGWVIYFFIKGALSIVIGTFVAPFILAKYVANSVQQKASSKGE